MSPYLYRVDNLVSVDNLIQCIYIVWNYNVWSVDNLT